ncbi:MAG: vitamin B12 dependent methionine synthase [Coprobacillaceae bacterium]
MIKETALRYLGYKNSEIPQNINILIDECIEEVDTLANFKHVHQTYVLTHQPLSISALDLNLDYPDLIKLLSSCDSCVVEACTLGIEIDRKLQYYSKINTTKMTIFDAVASSYLEYMCDQWDKKLPTPHTFRFCPGYGNVPLTLNNKIATILNTHKHIGLTVQESGLLLPQKSMIGIIGFGDNASKKDCTSCLKIKDCTFLRRGTTCYKNK